MPLLRDPVPRDQARPLREAVLRHATGEHRRRFAPLLHVGRPDDRARTVAASLAGTDHALRCDLVAALLARHPDPAVLVWLTRPGTLDLEDVDQAWLAASSAASAEAGRDLTWVVVTRHGWHDPRSGLRRTWRRIRG